MYLLFRVVAVAILDTYNVVERVFLSPVDGRLVLCHRVTASAALRSFLKFMAAKLLLQLWMLMTIAGRQIRTVRMIFQGSLVSELYPT
jgi:hypothetical protein